MKCVNQNPNYSFVVRIRDPHLKENLKRTFDRSTNQTIFRPLPTSRGTTCPQQSLQVKYFKDYDYVDEVDPKLSDALLSCKLFIPIWDCADITVEPVDNIIEITTSFGLLIDGEIDQIFSLECKLNASELNYAIGGGSPYQTISSSTTRQLGNVDLNLQIFKCLDQTLDCVRAELLVGDSHQKAHLHIDDFVMLKAEIVNSGLSYNDSYVVLENCWMTTDSTGVDVGSARNTLQFLYMGGKSSNLVRVGYDNTAGSRHYVTVKVHQFLAPSVGNSDKVYFFCDISLCFDYSLCTIRRKKRSTVHYIH